MQPTSYSFVNNLLAELLMQMQTALGQKLVGLYLYGSLVTGDFDPDISDVDLLAAVTTDVDEAEFLTLKTMHEDLLSRLPQWTERLEIAYLSLHGLKTFKTESSPIAIISPGEAFHVKQADEAWLVNWYMVREKGVTLFGPPPETIIVPITQAEFIQTIKEHVRAWREWLSAVRDRSFQAYAILTMCRALYTCTYGEQVSKLRAARWAQAQMPEWGALIEEAQRWRRAPGEMGVDHDATLSQTRRFVNTVIDRILLANP